MFHWSIVTLSDPLHWGISIFWREIGLIIYIGASTEWYRDQWIISCCPHCILRHIHLVGCFDIETWLSILWLLLLMDYGAIETLGLVFSAYLNDLSYLHTFQLVLRHSTLDTFMLSILPKLDHYLLLSHTSHHDTWPYTHLSIRRRRGSVLDHFGCAFIHLLYFGFNIFHDGRAWQIVDLLVIMLSFW